MYWYVIYDVVTIGGNALLVMVCMIGMLSGIVVLRCDIMVVNSIWC